MHRNENKTNGLYMSIKTVLLRCDLGSNKGLGSIGEFCREIV